MKKNCKKSEIYCGGTEIASNCVDYTGDTLTSLGKEVNQCDLSVTEVIEEIDKELKKVKDGLDTKKLVKLCITSIDKDDSIIIIINKLIGEICDLSKEIDNLKSNSGEFDILNSVVNIDSDCLSGSHCSNDSTLRSLLVKLISEICTLKSQINRSGSLDVFQP